MNKRRLAKLCSYRSKIIFLSFSSSLFLFLNLELPTDLWKHKSAEATAPAAGWTCKTHDQLSWCIYFHSLCLDRAGNILLVTNESSKHGKEVELLNSLEPSPWHQLDVQNIANGAFGRYDVPYRSFFKTAHYTAYQPTDSVTIRGWSLIAAFDAQNFNIYHFMNKLHAAFVTRIYEIGGLSERKRATSLDVVSKLESEASEFSQAYLFRPSPTSWQSNYAKLSLGNRTRFFYGPAIQEYLASITGARKVCFEQAIIPGAALYLADGFSSSALFREHAARLMGVRVPESQRNLVTIFDRRAGNRRIINLKEVKARLQEIASQFEVVVVDWDESVDFRTQALHMARTRIMVTTHGSVLNHNAFMEMGGVVIELNGYQFTYPLDDQIVLYRGNYYMRYEEALQNTRHQGYDWGQDPFVGYSTRTCMNDMKCTLARRDADVNINMSRFQDYFERALSLVT